MARVDSLALEPMRVFSREQADLKTRMPEKGYN
jgi:hypothetical protein